MTDAPATEGEQAFVPLIAGLFCGTLVATIILSGKIATLGGLTFPASIVLFPAMFLMSDVLTEVYGYAVARRVVWAGLTAEIVWIAGCEAAFALPSAAFWDGQPAFERVLGQTPRIAIAGMIAYVVSEFLNAYVLARLKVQTEGRGLPLRLMASTALGTGVDTIVVVIIAFAGIYAPGDLGRMVASVWLLKVLWAAAALPVSVPLIGWLKRRERSDVFDRGTDFNPFRVDG